MPKPSQLEQPTQPPRDEAPPVRRSFPDLVQWFRVGLAGLAFLGFSIGAALIAVLAMPWWWLLNARKPRFQRAAACQWWIKAGSTLLHDYMRWCGLIDFNPRLVDRKVPVGGFVIVANHPTLVDVCAVAGIYGKLTCVAKSALFKSPFIGIILRACDYINGGAGDPFSGGLVVRQGIERVTSGMPVLIFPEGTRSPEGGLRTFKRGAFEIACRANVPVLPLLIDCDPPTLGKGRPWYDIPHHTSRFRITPLATLDPVDFGRDPVTMSRACEDLFRRRLGLAPPIAAEDARGSRANA